MNFGTVKGHSLIQYVIILGYCDKLSVKLALQLGLDCFKLSCTNLI